MPLVGNDIVDLKDRANAQKNMDLRYLRKILADSEIDMVAAAAYPAAALWLHWASKEAAYKVIKKINSNASFVPRRWSVCVEMQETGIPIDIQEHGVYSDRDALRCLTGHVKIPDEGHVHIRLFSFSSCVHGVASDVSDALSGAVWGIVPMARSLPGHASDPSFQGRQALVQHVSKLLKLNPEDMKIMREKRAGELMPPRLLLRDELLPIDISLSHDGSYIAYAFHIRSIV